MPVITTKTALTTAYFAIFVLFLPFIYLLNYAPYIYAIVYLISLTVLFAIVSCSVWKVRDY